MTAPSTLDRDAATIRGVQVDALRHVSRRAAIGAILAFSVAVFAFLCWLVYFKHAAGERSSWIRVLPAINAGFNSLSTLCLILGYVAVRRRRYAVHVRFMLSAVVSSALFFACYVVYHHFHGDTRFAGAGLARPIYFFVLISHIVLSAVSVPLILTSLYLALSGRLASHRRVSRYTFPIWLYVSITGVAVFAMLKMSGSM